MNQSFESFLLQLIDLLTTEYLDEGGLLRVPGSQQKMTALQKWIESRWKSAMVDSRDVTALRDALADDTTGHELAGLLKQFLRQLPESLFTVALVDLFASVAGKHRFSLKYSTGTRCVSKRLDASRSLSKRTKAI